MSTALTQSLLVPSDFVIYKCKIGGGRVIDLPLPPKLARADVKRLCAFLESQVDEESEASPSSGARVGFGP